MTKYLTMAEVAKLKGVSVSARCIAGWLAGT
jgi:hypothetical protein